MMAMNDINIKGNVKNANDVVMYSKYGNINIESENINLNGLIYAPFGTVEISAENVDVNGIIIAKNVIINSECVNLTYNGSMAEFIGVDTEQMIIPYYDWSYIPDSNEDEIPDIVEEQIYEDPLSVDDEWLEDEYSSLIVEEYSAPMKKELVEVLYLSKTSKISNFTDIKDLLLMAIKGGYQKFIQLKTSINKAIKTIELNIYGYTIEVDTGDPENIYGPMPWKYYLKDETTDEDDVVSEKKKNQILDIGIFASLIASSTLAAGTVAVEKASEAVAGVAVALTGTVETAVNNAASAIGNTAADIAEEAKKAIEKELSKIADIDLFKIDIKETLEGYKIKILENLSIDLSKPIGGATEWVVGFTLETTGIDLKKVKNVIDLKTLENIKAVSNNIYTDIVRKIVSGDKPSEILNIVDCINTNTKEFKIAYDRLGDVDKAYSSVQEFIERYNSYDEAKYSIKDNGKELRDNLLLSNVIKPKYSFCAHHIVAKEEPLAKTSREILAKYGIDINSSANGVYLPGGKKTADFSWRITESSHFGGHSDNYLEYVNQQIDNAKEIIIENYLSKNDAIDRKSVV